MKNPHSDPNSEPEKRTCESCGGEYLHEPLIIGDTDFTENINECDPCSIAREHRDKKERRVRRAIKIWEATVPQEYRNTDLDHKDFPKDLLEKAESWLTKAPSLTFLGLMGESGRCKTRIAAQLVKRLIWSRKEVFWINSLNWQWSVQHLHDKREAEECAGKLNSAMSAPFLIFDDIGALKATEAISEQIYRLLEHRSVNGLKMIWTSNESYERMLVGSKITEEARKRSVSRLAGYSNLLKI